MGRLLRISLGCRCIRKCPLALRGDLTKWLQEISLGVYVGRVGARVRDELWKRICERMQGWPRHMVFPARNEQHFDYRVHNTTWGLLISMALS